MHIVIYTIIAVCFYRAMHYSAKRGIAIACRLNVRLSVCNVGGLSSHKLDILETSAVSLCSSVQSFPPGLCVHIAF